MSKLSRAHNLFTGVEEERLHYVSVFDIFLLGKSARLSRSIHFEGFFPPLQFCQVLLLILCSFQMRMK